MTLKVRRELPSLRSARLVHELERSFAAACERGRFRVVHYSVQPDHAHLIVEAASARELAAGMKSIGARLARAVNRVFARRGAVLADRYHLHVHRTPREVRHAIAYVLMNARRHLAKLGRRLPRPAVVDPASSGRWFDGWRNVRARDPIGPPPVAKPRTWLLAIGWRRHGLLDPTEVPGHRADHPRAGPPRPTCTDTPVRRKIRGGTVNALLSGGDGPAVPRAPLRDTARWIGAAHPRASQSASERTTDLMARCAAERMQARPRLVIALDVSPLAGAQHGCT